MSASRVTTPGSSARTKALLNSCFMAPQSLPKSFTWRPTPMVTLAWWPWALAAASEGVRWVRRKVMRARFCMSSKRTKWVVPSDSRSIRQRPRRTADAMTAPRKMSSTRVAWSISPNIFQLFLTRSTKTASYCSVSPLILPPRALYCPPSENERVAAAVLLTPFDAEPPPSPECGLARAGVTPDNPPRPAGPRPGRRRPAGRGPAGPGRRVPNVLLVTFDTTRADHLGAYGYAGARTPVVDRLAGRGRPLRERLQLRPAHRAVALHDPDRQVPDGARRAGQRALRAGAPPSRRSPRS